MTSTLLGPNGKPISSSMFAKAKKSHPLIGEIAVPWAGQQEMPVRFPLENTLQFDTSRLTLNDFRMMREHYQINSSITILTFLLHQVEWKVECDNIKVAKHCEDNLRRIWTRLVRALSQAFWAGFSPNALQWENDTGNGKLVITKVKDLRPEDCSVNWKEINGVSSRKPGQVARKVKIYDGISRPGNPDIPVDNSLWYPLLMENGSFYGKKLLKAAFQPWFFSSLIHMYSNRYFERYGEPVIVSRAPFDEKIDIGSGQEIQGNILMAGLNNMVRNGASVTLPNQRAQNGLDGVGNYDYTMEYLESQMRGADFERYLTRLDQEISLALFTPLLMMNTADGGSFNLGVVHTQMYLGMINAIAGDWKEYIDKYVLAPMARMNFGRNAKLPSWEFRHLGKTDSELVRSVLSALLTGGNGDMGVKVDLEELGQEIGLTLTEVELVREPPATEPADDGDGKDPAADKEKKRDTRVGRPERAQRGKGTDKKSSVSLSMADRISAQFIKALRDDVSPVDFTPQPGHQKQLAEFMEPREIEAFERDMIDAVWAMYEVELASDAPLESEIRATIRRLVDTVMGGRDAGKN